MNLKLSRYTHVYKLAIIEVLFVAHLVTFSDKLVYVYLKTLVVTYREPKCTEDILKRHLFGANLSGQI